MLGLITAHATSILLFIILGVQDFSMIRHFILFFAVFAAISPVLKAQNHETKSISISVPVENSLTVDANFLKLEQPNSQIRYDSILNEQIVDLVEPAERDSMLPSHTQHHRLFIGWFLHVFGYKWVAIDMHRSKLVGTAKDDLYAPGEEDNRFTEHDININLLPHIPKYIDLMYNGIKQQIKLNRHWKREHRTPDFSKVPFIYPTTATLNQYRVHCELTPPRKYYRQVTEKFYPCIAGSNFATHANFCDPRPTLGMYGAMVSDCNHTCHTEMHPYEWLWWLDLNPAEDTIKNTRRWVAGLFRESSNRFRDWSHRPRIGSIALPFIFPRKGGKPRIEIEHLVQNIFMHKKFKQFTKVPKDAGNMNFTDMTVALQGLESGIFVHTNKAIESEGGKIWFSDVKTDGTWIWGYIHLAACVRDLYTARITTSY